MKRAFAFAACCDVLFAAAWLLAAALVFARDRNAGQRYLVQALALALLAFGVYVLPAALGPWPSPQRSVLDLARLAPLARLSGKWGALGYEVGALGYFATSPKRRRFSELRPGRAAKPLTARPRRRFASVTRAQAKVNSKFTSTAAALRRFYGCRLRPRPMLTA